MGRASRRKAMRRELRGIYGDGVVEILGKQIRATSALRRGFFGRLKWLLLGR